MVNGNTFINLWKIIKTFIHSGCLRWIWFNNTSTKKLICRHHKCTNFHDSFACVTLSQLFALPAIAINWAQLVFIPFIYKQNVVRLVFILVSLVYDYFLYWVIYYLILFRRWSLSERTEFCVGRLWFEFVRRQISRRTIGAEQTVSSCPQYGCRWRNEIVHQRYGR